MIENIENRKIVKLSLNKPSNVDDIEKICYALSSKERISVLQSLISQSKSLSEIAIELLLPISTVSRYIDALQEAGLITINYKPALKGHVKVCSQKPLELHIDLNKDYSLQQSEIKEYKVELPVGVFAECDCEAPCGIAGKDDKIIPFDQPESFFTPDRINAERVWFATGHITYLFPQNVLYNHKCTQISFSFEICSETQFYNMDWPSDITVSINDKEICTFTTPSDFGGRRGNYTSVYWPVNYTQYGILKSVKVSGKGVYLDNTLISKDITFEDLGLYNENKPIKLTFAVKEDAVHKGGLNLFGKNYGDYNQAIIMRVK